MECDVVVIGAGPSGAVAAAILAKKGYQVTVVEKTEFPRFCIGESLLPQSMRYFEEAGMLEAIEAAGFQRKNGAAFNFREQPTYIDFREKFSPGHGTTFQVKRAEFDKILIDEAIKLGVNVYFKTSVEAIEISEKNVSLNLVDEQGGSRQLSAKFCLDASGYGRVLPRLLRLDRPSDLPPRRSLFAHIKENWDHPDFDREKILITVHPEHRDVWYWLIPFSDGTSSLGVVGTAEYFDHYPQMTQTELLKTIACEDPMLKHLCDQAEFHMEAGMMEGYSSNVSTLYGDRFALLGNAGEFLDPVFSSGVTVAVKSASLAANLLDRQFRGEQVDWQSDFADELSRGVEVFRAFVDAWYSGGLVDVFYVEESGEKVTRMIASILAGYVWDQENSYVAQPKRIDTLVALCQS